MADEGKGQMGVVIHLSLLDGLLTSVRGGL